MLPTEGYQNRSEQENAKSGSMHRVANCSVSLSLSTSATNMLPGIPLRPTFLLILARYIALLSYF